VAFLDEKHGENWAIWEFRAEGTGYPDEAVHHRIRHYPWPDHHPPPFRLVPMIMASMRSWLEGEALGGSRPDEPHRAGEAGENGRVVVVHCKAGKGRSGSMASSFLISNCGWSAEDALARFTERRMRPKFGAGVSIPSQLRWISYVDRWTQGGKKYVDREVEVVEVHVWGLRHGVKVSIEGFVENGRKIKVFHTFKADERFIVEGDAPGGAGVRDFVTDMADSFRSPPLKPGDVTDAPELEDVEENDENKMDRPSDSEGSPGPSRSRSKQIKGSRTAGILRSLSRSKRGESPGAKKPPSKSKTIAEMKAPEPDSSIPSLPPSLLNTNDDAKNSSQSSLPALRATTFAAQDEPGGQAVILKPSKPIRLETSDINLAVERRNKSPGSLGLTMVTAVAHVWFNVFFEGNGPEQNGRGDDSGVFEIEWDMLDGLKGSSRKGTRAMDRVSVVWRVAGTKDRGDGKVELKEADEGHAPKVSVLGPDGKEEVPQMEAADWKGGNQEDPEAEKTLGLRKQDSDSEGVSKASSFVEDDRHDKAAEESGDDPMLGVKTSGPGGEVLDAGEGSRKSIDTGGGVKGKAEQASGRT
jgi:protein-tyrosine phosphatase